MSEVTQEPETNGDPPSEVAVATFGAVTPGHEEAARERAHPQPAEYLKIAVILAAITLLEVAVFYLDLATRTMVPILVVLSATKFSLVALWYMHLKFDSRFFSWLFVFGMILAASVFIAAWSTLDILIR